jgi:hypothetical protein
VDLEEFSFKPYLMKILPSSLTYDEVLLEHYHLHSLLKWIGFIYDEDVVVCKNKGKYDNISFKINFHFLFNGMRF